MTTTAPRPRSETAEQILDLAETLIQTRGYSAFSYQDIADGLGIRKASIHYHFPSKTDLGMAVIDRYVARFGDALAAIGEDETQSSLAMLDFYVEPYVGFAGTPDRICLCGALAGEILALPPPLRSRVDGFFRSHQDWLTRILQRGTRNGEFALAAPPAKVARFIFSALQGALLVKRATGDAAQLRDVITVMKLQLTAGS
ncbi:TetR/AcrR family transcriptional regulator [Bradyrhizobium diazoefficiens]|nr:TetR/AcrR family transcriptional regulator [Bradyrhizobium diazoefficiens]MBR0850477.1 TetR/AcrR family transcriptional regulator [Bradyrhizobium diazoefficiens]